MLSLIYQNKLEICYEHRISERDLTSAVKILNSFSSIVSHHNFTLQNICAKHLSVSNPIDAATTGYVNSTTMEFAEKQENIFKLVLLASHVQNIILNWVKFDKNLLRLFSTICNFILQRNFHKSNCNILYDASSTDRKHSSWRCLPSVHGYDCKRLHTIVLELIKSKHKIQFQQN